MALSVSRPWQYNGAFLRLRADGLAGYRLPVLEYWPSSAAALGPGAPLGPEDRLPDGLFAFAVVLKRAAAGGFLPSEGLLWRGFVGAPRANRLES